MNETQVEELLRILKIIAGELSSQTELLREQNAHHAARNKTLNERALPPLGEVRKENFFRNTIPSGGLNFIDEVTKYLNSNESVEEFSEWAFGYNYGRQPVNMMDNLWNRRHKDKLEIKGSDIVKETIPRMIQIWRENK